MTGEAIRVDGTAPVLSEPILAPAPASDGKAVQLLMRTCQGVLEAIHAHTTPEKRCRAVCRQIARGLGFPRSLLSTVDHPRGRLVVRGAYDASVTGPLYRVLTGLWTAMLQPDAEGKLSVSAWCVEKKEQIYVRDSAHYDFRPELTYQRDRVVRVLGVKGYVLTPIVLGDEAIGILGVDTHGPREEVSADRLRMLAFIAEVLATVHDRMLRSSGPALDESVEKDAEPQALLDILDQGVLVVDDDDRVQYLNRATSRLLDVLPWEAVGRPWRDVLVLEKLEDFATLLRECGNGPSIPGRRWTIVRPSGGKIDVELKLLPLSSRSIGGARAVVMEDVSQRVELQRLRDEFTCMLVHDLKAPLQSIVGFAELLVTERLGGMNADQKEFVARIEQSGEQMMRLIEGILEVARYESGRSLMRKERVAPSPLVETIVQGLLGKALPARVEIRNTVGAGLPDLFADPLRLTQVFQNLIANAIHVSPPSGVIWVRGERTRDGAAPYVRFEVEDEGPGLSPEEATHLFDNLWATLGRDHGGLSNGGSLSHGLGLVIARLIVEGHRGSIVAHSRPERGTAVSFTIPVYRPDR